MVSPGRRRHAKRARRGDAADRQDASSDLSPPHPDWRDWASLMAGPAGLIAECALSNDIADYIRFRATCRPWRACCPDPRSSSISDRRFHPRRWIMLPSASKARNSRRCFLNVYTGQRIQVLLPEPQGYHIIDPIIEGLLVVCKE
ncbi:hypothetical protein PR202_ga29487 [Eleusine coracana subsp. coracana]|uniref:Uncharacterized protein n=1 Tax=Eleusine coracana subsp. coracana TaxID=191504 RepID=A0AAV5DMF5_ELECO|nr:hypothetical protein PR202_ga29487 [Eleusine coracana subsp. coracana]